MNRIRRAFTIFAAGAAMLAGLLPPLFAQDKSAPVATITEIAGKVEVQRGGAWIALAPLQPLVAGDRIRVSTPGGAVVTYFGGAPEAVTEANSPYVVKPPAPGKGRAAKAVQKVEELFRKMFAEESRRDVQPFVRGGDESLAIVQPRDSDVLFPEGFMYLQWKSWNPPYAVSVRQDDGGKKGGLVFEATTNEVRFAIPADRLHENTAYAWSVSTGSDQKKGFFRVKGREDSTTILNELLEISAGIPERYPLTRAVVQIAYLLDRKLYYDAFQLIDKSLVLFPKDEGLLVLLEKTGER